MARRRQMTGYGSAPPMKPPASMFPLPPPPDGKPPVRLPVGGARRMQPPMEDATGQSDEDLLLMLQRMGARPDQM